MSNWTDDPQEFPTPSITAVEWLLEQIENKNGKEFAAYYSEFIDQAKEMEKEQKQHYLETYFEWHKSVGFVSHTPEDIIEFNETFGKNL